MSKAGRQSTTRRKANKVNEPTYHELREEIRAATSKAGWECEPWRLRKLTLMVMRGIKNVVGSDA